MFFSGYHHTRSGFPVSDFFPRKVTRKSDFVRIPFFRKFRQESDIFSDDYFQEFLFHFSEISIVTDCVYCKTSLCLTDIVKRHKRVAKNMPVKKSTL